MQHSFFFFFFYYNTSSEITSSPHMNTLVSTLQLLLSLISVLELPTYTLFSFLSIPFFRGFRVDYGAVYGIIALSTLRFRDNPIYKIISSFKLQAAWPYDLLKCKSSLGGFFGVCPFFAKPP